MHAYVAIFFAYFLLYFFEQKKAEIYKKGALLSLNFVRKITKLFDKYVVSVIAKYPFLSF